ncbi:hypothetical protein EIP91_001079 [Steccherinum ochraceum]|uniref:YCII-related domain-containing protein n=1 Tax=Steccherinum ochraceum TaxID=92696 RepID=A0A4R0RES2_9APHY|nr:hypothetical protein EIP91_001079 [Steccherinum ochraceum]
MDEAHRRVRCNLQKDEKATKNATGQPVRCGPLVPETKPEVLHAGQRLSSSSYAKRIKPRFSSSQPSVFYAGIRRAMSSAAPEKQLFVIWAPDQVDANAFSRRLEVRQDHLKKLGPLFQSGVIKTGGVTITPETYLTESKKIGGSMLVVEMESLDAVRKFVEGDIYWSNNVHGKGMTFGGYRLIQWDKEKITILPFVSAAVPKA